MSVFNFVGVIYITDAQPGSATGVCVCVHVCLTISFSISEFFQLHSSVLHGAHVS